MFIFLSFVVSLISLYYLGVMADSGTTDTTYVTPLYTLLVFSIYSMLRELRKRPVSWLAGESYYEPQNNRNNYNNVRNNITYYNDDIYDASSYVYRPSTVIARNEKVEYFEQDKKEKKDDVKELTHYPSQSEIREKIKKLEESRWFRIKRSAAGVFGYDITEKYRKPRKIKSTEKVKPINSNNDSRYAPTNNWLLNKEISEYNDVVKHVGRCCEISILDEEVTNQIKEDEK